MTTPRSVIVNREIIRFYHVISRCVPRAHLCGDGKDHRKDWLETRLEELAGIFAIDVCAYVRAGEISILSAHPGVVDPTDATFSPNPAQSAPGGVPADPLATRQEKVECPGADPA